MPKRCKQGMVQSSSTITPNELAFPKHQTPAPMTPSSRLSSDGCTRPAHLSRALQTQRPEPVATVLVEDPACQLQELGSYQLLGSALQTSWIAVFRRCCSRAPNYWGRMLRATPGTQKCKAAGEKWTPRAVHGGDIEHAEMSPCRLECSMLVTDNLRSTAWGTANTVEGAGRQRELSQAANKAGLTGLDSKAQIRKRSHGMHGCLAAHGGFWGNPPIADTAM